MTFLALSLVMRPMNDLFCQFFSPERLFRKRLIRKHGLGCINYAVFSLYCKFFEITARNPEGCIILFLLSSFMSFNRDEYKFLELSVFAVNNLKDISTVSYNSSCIGMQKMYQSVGGIL